MSALRGWLGKRGQAMRPNATLAGMLTESQRNRVVANSRAVHTPRENFGGRNDQRHVTLELVQGLALEPISGLASLWRADRSHGAGFRHRIALTKG